MKVTDFRDYYSSDILFNEAIFLPRLIIFDDAIDARFGILVPPAYRSYKCIDVECFNRETFIETTFFIDVGGSLISVWVASDLDDSWLFVAGMS